MSESSHRQVGPPIGSVYVRFSLLCVGSFCLMASFGCGGSSAALNSPPPPKFTLSASPNALTLQQTASGSIALKVIPLHGFTGTVNLTASGLPSGVTASLSPPSTSSASTLSLSVSGSASTGGATVTITGTSGNLTTTISVALTVLVAPPAGSLPQSFFALNNVDPNDNPTGDGMLYGAVGHPIRLAWPYIETSRGVFDFTFYDQYAAIAPREGPNGIVAVMDLTLGMTPGWAKSDQSTCRTLAGGVIGCQAPPDNLQDWKDFVTALVEHYDGSDAAHPYIKYYEIWNEWNVNDAENGFWIGPIEQLVALEQTACSIIHARVLNFSLVVTPSTVGPARTAADMAPQQLNQFLQVGGGNCIDAVSFHGNLGLMSLNPYPQPGEGCTASGCNGSIVEIVDSYRQVLNLNGPLNVPLLDTEGGFESANISDVDQRAAWLAQFYILQAGISNSDQLQWVSWFTWGAPGVAGNIETASKTPDVAGVAYNQVFDWEFGRFPAPCAKSGTIWTCGLTGASGYQAVITWDDSRTCTGGTCNSTSQTAPAWATKLRDLSGAATPITGGSEFQLGLKPVILENQ